MTAFSTRSIVIAIVVLFTLAAFLASGVTLHRTGLFEQSNQRSLPRVTNRTASIRIGKIQRLDTGDVEVSLSNESAKSIYAYTIVTGQQGFRKGFTTFATAMPVGPGETKTETIPRHNLDSAASEIILSAVYLEGGAIEGDPPDSRRLKQTMQGMKEQAKRAVELLGNAVNASEQNPQHLLVLVESNIASMSVNDEASKKPREQQQGAAMINDRLLDAIKKLRAKPGAESLNIKGQLAELIPYYQRLAEKL